MTMLHQRRFLAHATAIVAAMSLWPAAASAQDRAELKVEGRPKVIEQLFDCREIADPAARLVCFDREVAAIDAAEQADDLVFADREQLREARRGLFGFNIPKLRLFGGGKDEEDEGFEEVERLETTLASARQVGSGTWLFVLEDGARWMQSENEPVLGRPGAGDAIVIEKAALGSYMARINGKRGIRVRRVN